MRKIIVGIVFASLFLYGCVNEQTNTEDKANNPGKDIQTNQQLPLLSPDRILNIAHRGASGHAPEHTMESYKLGQQMNGDYIEIDLQMTKDGTLIAMHDPDIARTSNKEGKINQLTLKEIKQLDVGSWFNELFPDKADPKFANLTVPTLEEIITEFGMDANYYIETKQPEEDPGMVKELIKVLEKHDLIGPDIHEGQVIIQSFSSESLQEVHALEPSLSIIQLISYDRRAQINDQEIKQIKEYAIGIGANYKHLSKEYVEQVRNAELLLHPYTVNEKSDMKLLIDWGVTGMFTNYPDRLNEVLEEIKE